MHGQQQRITYRGYFAHVRRGFLWRAAQGRGHLHYVLGRIIGRRDGTQARKPARGQGAQGHKFSTERKAGGGRAAVRCRRAANAVEHLNRHHIEVVFSGVGVLAVEGVHHGVNRVIGTAGARGHYHVDMLVLRLVLVLGLAQLVRNVEVQQDGTHQNRVAVAVYARGPVLPGAQGAPELLHAGLVQPVLKVMVAELPNVAAGRFERGPAQLGRHRGRIGLVLPNQLVHFPNGVKRVARLNHNRVRAQQIPEREMPRVFGTIAQGAAVLGYH